MESQKPKDLITTKLGGIITNDHTKSLWSSKLLYRTRFYTTVQNHLVCRRLGLTNKHHYLRNKLYPREALSRNQNLHITEFCFDLLMVRIVQKLTVTFVNVFGQKSTAFKKEKPNRYVINAFILKCCLSFVGISFVLLKNTLLFASSAWIETQTQALSNPLSPIRFARNSTSDGTGN